MLNLKYIQALVKEGLQTSGLSKKEASLQATGKEDAIGAILVKGYMPSVERFEKICRVLGIEFTVGFSKDDIGQTSDIPHLGYIAAGGGDDVGDSRIIPLPQGTEEYPALPSDITTKTRNLLAMTVKGNSMAPAYYDGDRVYVYKNDSLSLDTNRLIGKDCAITLEDGSLFLKRLRRPDSGQRGEWNLESINPLWPTMANQKIYAAFPIRYTKRQV